MPLPVDNLSETSGDPQIQEAISASIDQCMTEPIPAGTDVTEALKQKWCAGKSYGIARTKTGRQLNAEGK